MRYAGPGVDAAVVRWRPLLATLAAAADVAALGLSRLSLGTRVCMAPARPGGRPTHCHPVPIIHAFASPLGRVLMAAMLVAGLIPLLTLRKRRRWPILLSGGVQFLLQFLAIPAFFLWLPTFFLTVAAAAARAPEVAGPPTTDHPA